MLTAWALLGVCPLTPNYPTPGGLWHACQCWHHQGSARNQPALWQHPPYTGTLHLHTHMHAHQMVKCKSLQSWLWHHVLLQRILAHARQTSEAGPSKHLQEHSLYPLTCSVGNQSPASTSVELQPVVSSISSLSQAPDSLFYLGLDKFERKFSPASLWNLNLWFFSIYSQVLSTTWAYSHHTNTQNTHTLNMHTGSHNIRWW